MNRFQEYALHVLGRAPETRSEGPLVADEPTNLGVSVDAPVRVDADADVVAVVREHLEAVPHRVDRLQSENGSLDGLLQRRARYGALQRDGGTLQGESDPVVDAHAALADDELLDLANDALASRVAARDARNSEQHECHAGR